MSGNTSTVTRDIRPDEIGTAWMYRIGVPLPSSAVTELADGTQVRHITMGKGIQFDQIAADWQPNRRIRWTYRFTNIRFHRGTRRSREDWRAVFRCDRHRICITQTERRHRAS